MEMIAVKDITRCAPQKEMETYKCKKGVQRQMLVELRTQSEYPQCLGPDF